jgi:hypothetical protein
VTFDPKTNRVPYGLLNEDEQTVLTHWPHGYEFWNDDNWDHVIPSWADDTVYRGKPAPVVVSWYLNIEPQHGEFRSRHFADLAASPSRIAVLRIDTCNGVSTAHLEDME